MKQVLKEIQGPIYLISMMVAAYFMYEYKTIPVIVICGIIMIFMIRRLFRIFTRG